MKCTKCNKEVKDDFSDAIGFDYGDDWLHVVGGDWDYEGGRSRGVFHKKCYEKILKYAGVKK
jgi:hypothetical protein